MVPITTELFMEAENGEKYVLCRRFERKLRVASNYSWIRPKETIYKLLTNGQYSFPNAWIVGEPLDQLFHVPLKLLLTKGLYVEHNKQKYTMPLGNFNHD